MIDPVILNSGLTYDRCNIERWIVSGNNYCPLTRIEIVSITPNKAMEELIMKFLESDIEPEPELEL